MVIDPVVYEQLKDIIIEYFIYYDWDGDPSKPTLASYLDKHPFYDKATSEQVNKFLDYEAYILKELVDKGKLEGVVFYTDHSNMLCWKPDYDDLKWITLQWLWLDYRAENDDFGFR